MIPVGLVFFFFFSESFDVALWWSEVVCGADLSCVEVKLGWDRSGVGIYLIWRELVFVWIGVRICCVNVNLDGTGSCVSGIQVCSCAHKEASRGGTRFRLNWCRLCCCGGQPGWNRFRLNWYRLRCCRDQSRWN